MKQAVQHIKSLMANLDSEVICTVQNNMSELRRYVNVPDEGMSSSYTDGIREQYKPFDQNHRLFKGIVQNFVK